MPKSTYFLDAKLVPRIKKILRAHQGRASVSYLIDELQSQYGEYARKKKNVLLKSVEKGFDIAVKELLKEGIQISTNSTSSDSDTDSEANLHKDKNIMNSMISSMYRQATPGSENMETSSLQSTPDISHKNLSKRTSQLKGAHSELNTSYDREPLNWYIDRGPLNTKTSIREMRQEIKHDRIVNLINGENTFDKKEENISPKEPRPMKRRRESPDGLRKRKKQKQVVYPGVNFSNIGGNESVLKDIEECCQFLDYPELLPKIKGDLSKSFLIHGPTGCGKTLLANAIAGEYKLPLLSLTGTELVGGISGDSEANIRDLFDQAAELAPCILLIDDVDAIAAKRETATKGMESRVVTQLANSMDDLRSKNLPVLMICTTNRPNSLDESFRRTGRFDIEYALRFPNRDARESILQALCQEVQLADDVSFSEVAHLTPGYVGSDLKTLISRTNTCFLHRIISEYRKQCRTQTEVLSSRRQKVIFSPEEVEQFVIILTKADFLEAMTKVKPTAKQEDVILVPNTTWDDIGGLDNIRKTLNLCIMERNRRPELYKSSGITTAAGVLLVGPPGCGKTSVAKAVANEAGINFLYIKGAELLNKYVGESEKNVRDLFMRAASLAPCVIFFDEIDAICPRRSSGSDDGSTSRVTIQLLCEMSGLEQRSEVYVIAATNRLDKLDPALLRPGRMDKIIYVGLPNPEGRVEILRALTKNGAKPKLASDVDLQKIGMDQRCDGFSGADLGNLVQVAIEASLEQIIESTEASQPCEVLVVSNSHFEVAFESVSASVDAESKKNYEAVRKHLNKQAGKKNLAVLDADSRADISKTNAGCSMDVV